MRLLGLLKKGWPDNPTTLVHLLDAADYLVDDLNDGVTGGDGRLGLDGELDIGKLGGVGHGHDDAVLVTGGSDLGAVDILSKGWPAFTTSSALTKPGSRRHSC